MKRSLIIFIVFIACYSSYSQTAITQDGTDSLMFYNNGSKSVIISPEGNVRVGGVKFNSSSSILELNSTTGGLLIPRMTLIERAALTDPVEGLMIYNTTTSRFNLYSGGTWKVILMGSGNFPIQIEDADADTRVIVEGTTDSDTISFYTAGTKRMVISSSGNAGLNTSPLSTAQFNVSTTLGAGIKSEAQGANSTNIGVSGTASGAGLNSGLYGSSTTALSTDTAYGVIGQVSISGTGLGGGIVGSVSASSSNGTVGVQGASKGTGTGAKIGISGIGEQSDATSSVVYGGIFDANALNGTNVSGINAKSTQDAAGTSGTFIGGTFSVITNGTANYTMGVYSGAGTGTDNYAGYFDANGGGTNNYGIYSNAINATGNNYSAFFDNGRVYVKDSLALGTTFEERLSVNGRIHLADVGAPATTTDKLYNDAGNLYWNGTQLGISGGEINTASNIGVGGVGLFDNKAGADLQFRNINVGSSKVTVTFDGVNSEVDIDVDETSFDPTLIPNTPFGNIASTDIQSAINELDAEKGTGDFMSDGTVVMTGDIDLGSNYLSNVANPISAQDGATKSYVDAAVAGAGDNLGDHTATSNVILGSNYLSGDGGNEGIAVDANGNVGIGITTPSEKLHLQNGTFMMTTVTTPGTTTDRLYNVGGNLFWNGTQLDAAGSAPSYIADSDNDTKIEVEQAADEDYIRFNVSGTEAMTINSAGNIGIGTTTPNKRGYGALSTVLTIGNTDDDKVLEFAGDRTISNSNIGIISAYNSNFTSGEKRAANILMRSTTVSNDGYLTIETLNGGSLAERMRIDPAGNMGIGTTSPSEKLHLESGVFMMTTVTTPATTTDRLYNVGGNLFWNGTQLDVAGGSSPWSSGAGTIYPTTITDNVGVGTASPSYNFHATETATSGRAIFAEATSGTGTTYGVQAESTSSSGRGVYSLASANAGTTYGVYAQNQSTSGIGVYGYATKTTGATVGVKGEISSTSSNAYAVYGKSNGTTGLTYGIYGENASSTGTGVYGYESHPTGVSYGVRGQVVSSNGYAGYFQGGKNYFEGNVGIGTSSPADKLEIEGTTATMLLDHTAAANYSAVLFAEGGTIDGYVGQQGSTNNREMEMTNYSIGASSGISFKTTTTGPTTATRMRIDNSGNVGIGTTTPSEKLHLENGTFMMTTVTTPATTIDRLYNVGGNLFWNGTQLDVVGGSSPWVDGGAGDIYLADLTNYVGVGTNAPSEKLSIGAFGTASSTATQQPSERIALTGSFWNGASEVLHNITLENIASSTINEAGHLAIGWNGSELMGVHSSGNVGIGTTAPSSKMHILNSDQTDPTWVSKDMIILEDLSPSLQLHGGTASDASLGFSDDVRNVGSIFYNFGDNSMRLSTNSSERMRITSLGYVGIGATVPGYALQIGSAATVATNFWVYGKGVFETTTNTASFGALTLRNTNSSSQGVSIDFTTTSGASTIQRSSVGGVASGTDGGGLVFITKDDGLSTWTEKMRIDDAGNVGIGTNNPVYKLDVAGDARVGWHGNSDTLLILPSEFQVDNDAGQVNGNLIQFNEDANPRGISVDCPSGCPDLVATIPIPAGYKATHTQIFGNAASAIIVYESDISTGMWSQLGTTGNVNTEYDHPDATNSNGLKFLTILVNAGASTDKYYGGYVLISPK